MNPRLALLQPYPFQKLAALFEGLKPPSAYHPINLSVGEPKHKTPGFILTSLSEGLDGLSVYPATAGGPDLRAAIATWLKHRHGLTSLDSETQVLPVNGSREALFAFAQAVIDGSQDQPVVVCPNPFYQIYEGAALLAGAETAFLNTVSADGFTLNLDQLPAGVWEKTQLVYACSPGNPAGNVITLDEWRKIFDYADRFRFVIASDECYSEIYLDEDNPPVGALAAAHRLGRSDYARLVVFGSLSKRSNVPGMRSGFVAGDATVLKPFLHYRTYHGCAMNPAVQAASVAAWKDEGHVIENRRLYKEKFAAVERILAEVAKVRVPPASFYLWLPVPGSDTEFAKRLYGDYNVTVLPGSYLSRQAHGVNPGDGFVRIALVAALDECVSAAERIRECITHA